MREARTDASPEGNGQVPRSSMPQVSILFPDPLTAELEGEPGFFRDVLLDQSIEALTRRRGEYELAPYYYTPLHTPEEVDYRQEVFRDLDGTPLTGHLVGFCQKISSVRRGVNFATQCRDPQVAWRWILDAANTYVIAVRDIHAHLSAAHLRSAGLHKIRDYLAGYLESEPFTRLASEAKQVSAGLDRLRYSLTVRGGHVTVRPYVQEEDYAAQVLACFERFRHGEVKEYRVEYKDTISVGHIEAQVLERIARLFPEPFAALERFAAANRELIDPTIALFDRQTQFYLAYLEHLASLRAAGLAFCYPQVTEDRRIEVHDTFDLPLADKLTGEHQVVVRNDIRVEGAERIVVVTGPNQGGKTTYARTIAQLCHLARLGLPVPGTSARLPLIDAVHSHFERGENLTDLRGKLQDDLIRIREILERATGRSLIVLNEIFTSTTLEDALALSSRILAQVTDLDALCVCVTFIDELATLNEKTTSVVAGVDALDPTVRTFRLERRPADGRAYAAALAAKHQLTYRDVRQAIAP
jgi:DNA mismatch repair protein MutS